MFENPLVLLLILETILLLITYIRIQFLKTKIEIYEGIVEGGRIVGTTRVEHRFPRAQENEDESDGGFAWLMLLLLLIFVALCIF